MAAQRRVEGSDIYLPRNFKDRLIFAAIQDDPDIAGVFRYFQNGAAMSVKKAPDHIQCVCKDLIRGVLWLVQDPCEKSNDKLVHLALKSRIAVI